MGGRFILRAAVGNLILGAALWVARGEPAAWLDAEATARAFRLCAVIGAGIAVYAAAMLGLGLRPRDFTTPAAPTAGS